MNGNGKTGTRICGGILKLTKPSWSGSFTGACYVHGWPDNEYNQQPRPGYYLTNNSTYCRSCTFTTSVPICLKCYGSASSWSAECKRTVDIFCTTCEGDGKVNIVQECAHNVIEPHWHCKDHGDFVTELHDK